MLLATSYPFLEVVWTMFVFFAFIVWLWILFTVLTDVFRRRDIGGGSKVLWTIFIIVLPYLGVFIYLIAEHDGMTKRSIEAQEQAKGQLDDYVRSVGAASSPADQISKAQDLLSKGTISQAEFDQIKAKALAA